MRPAFTALMRPAFTPGAPATKIADRVGRSVGAGPSPAPIHTPKCQFQGAAGADFEGEPDICIVTLDGRNSNHSRSDCFRVVNRNKILEVRNVYYNIIYEK